MELANLKEAEVMAQNDAEETVTVDGNVYKLSDLSDQAKTQLANIAFCDARIQQLSNEWAIADTARIGYSAALRREAKTA